jgi:hypothetical protein
VYYKGDSLCFRSSLHWVQQNESKFAVNCRCWLWQNATHTCLSSLGDYACWHTDIYATVFIYVLCAKKSQQVTLSNYVQNRTNVKMETLSLYMLWRHMRAVEALIHSPIWWSTWQPNRFEQGQQCPLKTGGGLGRVRSLYGRFGQHTTLLPLPQIDARFLRCRAHSVVTTLTTLSLHLGNTIITRARYPPTPPKKEQQTQAQGLILPAACLWST